jgi:[ribosomal protein S5]-alanine N-acetyltransferase
VQRWTVLSTRRLTLTTWVEEDLGELALLHSDPETMRYVRLGRPESREESRDLLASYLREQADRGWTKWRVADQHGRLAGRAGFGGHGPDRELGYTIRRDMWGQGMASEIAQALVRWHRGHNGTVPRMRLLAYAAVENLPSRRVLEKAGLVSTGHAEHNGMNCAVYELPGEP